MVAALFSFGAMLLAAAPGGIALAEFIGAVVMTAFTALGSLIFAPKKSSNTTPFEPTPYTRREVGGVMPVVVGNRRTYGVEVFRKNDSSYPGASSRQFFQINYGIGPIAFISEIRVFGESNIFDLGFSGAHSSVLDFRYGTSDQIPTGHGWTDIGGDPSEAKNKYDSSLCLKLTPDTAHAVSYSGRAGINIFLAADEQGRNNGMNVAVDAVVSGILCRRFKDQSGDYICHVGDHNQYAEIYASDIRYTGTVATGTYTAAELADAVETALNAALDDDSGGHSITFTVTYSAITDKFTIQADTADVRLLTWSGSHRGESIWDDLGLIRGARYGFDPTATGGNDFDDLRLSGSGPYTISTYEDFSFTKTFSRNPIRICYEMRTNPNLSPGIEHPDDFEQSLMYAEEQYCNGIVNVHEEDQYDVRPINVLPMLKRIYGADSLITGTVAKPNELLNLVDGSRAADAATPVQMSSDTVIPQIIVPFNSGTMRYQVNQVVIKTSSAIAQSYTVQYVLAPARRIKRNGAFIEGWTEADWKDFPSNAGVVSGQVGHKTIDFTAIIIYAIRIISFSAISGNFILTEIEVKTTGNVSRNIAINARVQALNATVMVSALGSKDLGRLVDGSTSATVEFSSVPTATDDIYYQITFPFKRRIGLIVLATNVGEPQSYTVKYQAETGGAWTDLATRTNVQGTDYCFVTPTELKAFRITNMSRGSGSQPFTITEIEAYDAIPSVRYTLDAINEDGQKFSEFMLRLYESFNAIPCDQYGTRFIRVERHEAAVQELNDKHIISCSRKPTPRREMVNQWLIRFSNELKDYEADMIAIDDHASQLREFKYPGGGTGNVVIPREIELAGVTRPMQARRMGHVIKNRARYGFWVYSLVCRPGTVIGKLGDIVRINKPSSRINNKYARIMRMVYRADHCLEIEAMEHFENVYNPPVIEVGDIEFSRDASGSGGSVGVIPGDVQDVVLTIVEPGDYGVSSPMMQVSFTPPDDPNYSYSNIWVNWNQETGDSGDPLYRLEGTGIGDGAFVAPINATGDIDDEFKIRVVVQSVSKTESKKSITQIVAAWERGENTSVAETVILFDGTQVVMNKINALYTSQASSGKTLKVFLGDASQTLFVLDDPYRAESTEIKIDGIGVDRKVVGINDGTDGSPEAYEYEESGPTAGEIAFAYPPANGAIISIGYSRSTTSW